MKALQVTAVTVLVVAIPMIADSHPVITEPSKVVTVAWIGEIVDPMCYAVHDARGPGHAACAERCARAGQDLAFLEYDASNVYPIIANGHGVNPNDRLYAFIGKRTEVKGLLFRKAGTCFLQIGSIVEVPGKGK